MSDHYAYLRAHRPELLAACVEVGSIVLCAHEDVPRLKLAADAEARAVEIVAKLLRESDS